MLNLDTEDWPEIFIGCAGGGDSRLALPVAYAPVPPGAAALQVCQWTVLSCFVVCLLVEQVSPSAATASAPVAPGAADKTC